MLRPYENEIRDYTERARIAMMIKTAQSVSGQLGDTNLTKDKKRTKKHNNSGEEREGSRGGVERRRMQ
jgi:hypothetical protein